MKLLVSIDAWGAPIGGEVFVQNQFVRICGDYPRSFDTSMTIIDVLQDEHMTSRLPAAIDPIWIPEYKSKGHFFRQFFRMVRSLWRPIRDADVVLIYVPCLHSLLSLVLARFARRPAIVLAQGSWMDVGGSLRSRRGPRMLATATTNLVALLATRLLTYGGSLIDEVVRPLRHKAVAVNQSTLVESDFAPIEASRYEDRDQLELLCVARLIPTKRVDVAIETIKELRAREIAARLTVVGEGPERRRLERLIADWNLAGAVRLRGFLDDRELIRDQYRSAFALLLPSEREGISLAVQEAMAGGVVVISTPAGGLRDFLEHERTALVVETPDPRAFADAAQRLIASPEMAMDIAQRAQQKVSAGTNEEWIRQFEALVSEIVGRKKRRAGYPARRSNDSNRPS
jgi:glycosyltransferase involved in cell wall biosynthesis